MGVNSSWFTHNWAIIPLFGCARQAVIVISMGKVNGCLKSFDLKDILEIFYEKKKATKFFYNFLNFIPIKVV